MERTWDIRIGNAGYTIWFEYYPLAHYTIVINNVLVAEGYKTWSDWEMQYPFRFNGHKGKIIKFSEGWIRGRSTKWGLVIDEHTYADDRKTDVIKV